MDIPKYHSEHEFTQNFRWNELLAQRACAQHFGWHGQLIVPNVMFGGGEADLLVVNPRQYVTEVEIKLSPGDWQADRKKAKWADPARSGIRYFAYAVPPAMLSNIPDWVSPQVGLIQLEVGFSHPYRRYDVWAKWYRKPKPLSKERLPAAQREKLLQSLYYRYWQGLHKLPIMSPGMLEGHDVHPEFELEELEGG